jgi:hypothetical protein
MRQSEEDGAETEKGRHGILQFNFTKYFKKNHPVYTQDCQRS